MADEKGLQPGMWKRDSNSIANQSIFHLNWCKEPASSLVSPVSGMSDLTDEVLPSTVDLINMVCPIIFDFAFLI